MFYDRFHHDVPQHEHPTGGWANTHLGYEAAMTVLVAMIVVTVASILFLPVWVR